MAYAAFGTLGVIVLSVIIGAVVYGLQAGNSGQPGLAAHRDFQVRLPPCQQQTLSFAHFVQHPTVGTKILMHPQSF